MATWKQVADSDGSYIIIITWTMKGMKKGRGDQTTTIFFVSGAGHEVYVTVK